MLNFFSKLFELLTITVVLAANGSGAVSVSPSFVYTNSTGNTLTFTFTSAETMDGGEVSINTPSGWSVPQGISGTTGYTTVNSESGIIANVEDSADSVTGWSVGSACANGISVDATTKQEGTGAIKCANGNEGNNDRWYKNTTTENWSSYTKVAFWIRLSGDINNGNLRFAYDNNANLASPIEQISLGNITANTWNYLVLNFGNTTRTSVASYGFVIRNNSNLDNVNVWVDDILVGPGSLAFPGAGDIRARLLQLGSGQTVAIAYGSGGGTSGATAPSSTGNYTFTSKSRISSSGTLVEIASSPSVSVLAPPSGATKFVILDPSDSTVEIPVTVTVQAQKSDSTVDVTYQNDVTLVTIGSATGGGLVNIVDGVGTININDSVAETITLSLSDTEITGLDVSSTQDIIFSAAPSVVWDQNNFWFRDDDGTEVSATGYGTGDINKNVNITNVGGGTNVRLRFSIKASSDNGNISPQIEFKEGNGSCATGDWTTITPTSNAFSLQLSSNFTDGDPTTQQISTGQFIAGKILESTNPAPVNTITQNKSTEYEWLLQSANDIPQDTTYTFRISNNGTALNTYSQCPTFTSELSVPPTTNVQWVQRDFWFRDDDGTEITASGWGTADASQDRDITIENEDQFQDGIFRLRMGIRANLDDGGIIPQLEFINAKSGDNCSIRTSESGNVWQAISADSGKAFVLRDSPNIINQTLTTHQIIGGTFTSGLFLDTENPAPLKLISRNNVTEYEWSLLNTRGFERGAVYLFRLTNSGTPLNNYEVCPKIVFPAGPSGGVRPTTVSFSGWAYPDAKLTVVARDYFKEIPVKQSQIISSNGNFDIEFSGVLQGIQTYGLIITDKDNRVAQTKAYNINTISNSVTDKNIFSSPTLGFRRTIITKGDFLTVVGYATPGNQIEVEIDGRIIKKVFAGDDGSYQLIINTADFSYGNHRARSRQRNGAGRASDFSPQKMFVVSTLTIPKTDFNNDGIINISDWSIFLSRWGSKEEDIRKRVDLNNDGKVDISDFSIFIRTIKK